MAIKRAEDLRVYQSAYKRAMEIFERTRGWPKEERYALTDQIRRSSRAVCANLAEAWRKRRYEKHFISKLSDADAEAAETRTWLHFAQGCGYLEPSAHADLDRAYDRICGGLVNMMSAPEKWCGPSSSVHEETAPYQANTERS